MARSLLFILTLALAVQCSQLSAFSDPVLHDELTGEIEICLWHARNSKERKSLESIVNEFNCINRQKTRVRIESFGLSGGSVAGEMLLSADVDRLPDLALVERDSIPMLAESGLIVSLDDTLESRAESDYIIQENNLLDSALAYGTFDDRLWGFPAYLNPYVLICDSEALSNDSRIIGPPKDWEDLVDLGEMMRKDNGRSGANRWLLSVRSMSPVFYILCAQKGVNLFEPTPKSIPIVKKNLGFVQSLRQKHSLLPPQYKYWDSKFAGVANGRALFQMDEVTMFAHLKRTSERLLTASAVPAGTESSTTVLSRAPVFVLSSAAKTEPALEFLEFFYSPERYARFVEELMIVSPWKDVILPTGVSISQDGSYAQIVAAAKNAAVHLLHKRTGTVKPQIDRIVEKLDAGLISLERASEEIAAVTQREDESASIFPNNSVRVSWAENTRRVLADGSTELRPVPVRIVSAQNEHESFQFIISAGRSINNLSLSFEPVVSSTGSSISVKMTAALVNDTLISRPLVSNKAGTYPNVLKPLGEFEASPKKVARLWIDAHIPDSVSPGEYSSRIIIERKDLVLADVPLKLRVLPLKIPTTPSKPALIGLNYGLIAKHYEVTEGSEEYRELMNALYWFFVERRMTPLQPPVPVDSPELADYMNDDRVSGCRLGLNPSGNRFREAVLLAQKGGWLKKMFSYFIDEPTYHQYDEIINAGKRIHSTPTSPRFLVTCFPDNALIGVVDIWCIHLGFLPVGIPHGPMDRQKYAEAVRRRLHAGDEVWWYTAGAVAPFPTLHVEDDPTAFRIIPWMQQFYGIDGFLHWESANWSQALDDPFIDFFGNGEGVLVYPGEMRPLPSIRLELLREGFEDMELLLLLRNTIERIRKKLEAEQLKDAASKRVAEICRHLIRDDALRVFATSDLLLLSHFSREPDLIGRVREIVANEVISLEKRPYAIVLTEPEEKQYTESEEARIYGVTEPGCRIEINGRHVSVGKTGDFSDCFPLHEGTNDLRILLQKDKQTKLIHRKIDMF